MKFGGESGGAKGGPGKEGMVAGFYLNTLYVLCVKFSVKYK